MVPTHTATDKPPKDELMDRIRVDATVSESVRERALEFAPQFWKKD
jgi:hypothetical protein